MSEAVITRTEFCRSYAKLSGLSDEWASLGIVDIGTARTLCALPCICDEEGCEGWAMKAGGI